MPRLLCALAIASGAAAGDPALAQAGAMTPEFFEVTGVTAGDTLNLRQGPGTAEPIVAELSRGTVLRNLGCTGVDETRWCEVETSDGGLHGWAASRFLRDHTETAAPTPAAAAVQDIPPTGQLVCSVGGAAGQSCPFVVSRDEDGATEIVVTFPDGFERTLVFSQGEVNSPDPTDDVTSDQADGKTVVEVNGVERIEVPDAAIPAN